MNWTHFEVWANFLTHFGPILRFGRTFKMEHVPEDEFYTKIGHAIPYILSFWSML